MDALFNQHTRKYTKTKQNKHTLIIIIKKQINITFSLFNRWRRNDMER